MIENTIYTRLTLTTSLTDRVESRIFPTIPAENVPELPFVVYRVSNTEPQLHTQGVSSITKYTVEIDSYGKNMTDALEVMGAARTALHGFRGGEIQGAFLSGQSSEEIEEGYHGQQAFTVWASAANVVATQDITGLVTTGANSVIISACNSSLTLDCSGLKINGSGLLQSNGSVEWESGQTRGIRGIDGDGSITANVLRISVDFAGNTRDPFEQLINFRFEDGAWLEFTGTVIFEFLSAATAQFGDLSASSLSVSGVAAASQFSGDGAGLFNLGGTFKPASIADVSAEPNTIYFSTTSNKLAYKDASYVVHNLY